MSLAGRAMPSRLGSLPRRMGAAATAAPVEPHYKAWYRTARWRALRWSVLVAAAFQCARCGAVDGTGRGLVADHRVPHRGDPVRFWDEAGLQCLCAGCHSRAKQAEERAAGW